MTEFVTHDVKRFIISKPDALHFIPGQASLLSVNETEWAEKKNPFTFTNLNNDSVLEFIIKKYEEHNGVTKKLHSLTAGDEILIGEPFGTINYKKKGVFIAGGAGITPFIAILRELKEKGEIKGNQLIFSNKTWKDIILEREFKEMLGKDLSLILTREKIKGYDYGRVDEAYLKEKIKDFKQNFYICGPPAFLSDITEILEKLGADIQNIIFEGK